MLAEVEEYFSSWSREPGWKESCITAELELQISTTLKSLQRIETSFGTTLSSISHLGTNVVENYFSIVQSKIRYPNFFWICLYECSCMDWIDQGICNRPTIPHALPMIGARISTTIIKKEWHSWCRMYHLLPLLPRRRHSKRCIHSTKVALCFFQMLLISSKRISTGHWRVHQAIACSAIQMFKEAPVAERSTLQDKSNSCSKCSRYSSLLLISCWLSSIAGYSHCNFPDCLKTYHCYLGCLKKHIQVAHGGPQGKLQSNISLPTHLLQLMIQSQLRSLLLLSLMDNR